MPTRARSFPLSLIPHCAASRARGQARAAPDAGAPHILLLPPSASISAGPGARHGRPEIPRRPMRRPNPCPARSGCRNPDPSIPHRPPAFPARRRRCHLHGPSPEAPPAAPLPRPLALPWTSAPAQPEFQNRSECEDSIDYVPFMYFTDRLLHGFVLLPSGISGELVEDARG